MAEPKRTAGAPLVRAVVPNRVDIAGGTLDIFPLYLLVPGSMTVNAAIHVASVVSIPPVRGAVRAARGRGMGRLLGMRKSWRETAREAMEIEAAHLRNLTGSQDHIAALRGGIQGIRYPPGRPEPERIAPGSPVGRTIAAAALLAGTGGT